MNVALNAPTSNITNGFGTAGFVVVDTLYRLVVLSFRGTDGRSNQSNPTNKLVFNNSQILFPQDGCLNCLAADGYLPAFRVFNNKMGLANVDVIDELVKVADANVGF
jgi:hypothetical protein